MARKKEGLRLAGLLDEAGTSYEYDVDSNEIHIDYVLENHSNVRLTAIWIKDFISISAYVMELDEDEIWSIPPGIITGLLRLNAELYHAKFCLNADGLFVMADVDAPEMSSESITVAIDQVLAGVEAFAGCLAEWIEANRTGQDAVRHLVYVAAAAERDERPTSEAVSQSVHAESQGERRTISKALIGLAKFGLTAGTLATIATACGVPAAGIGAVLAAFAGTHKA